jgi:hypothetical protein
LESGNPASKIIEVAKKKNWSADLIVMGNHGRGKIQGLLLGNVSQEVLHHALCPVLVVGHRAKQTRYEFVPLSRISPDFQHAVIAEEDARFYQHHGFDWHAMQIAAEDDMEGSRIRGGSLRSNW